MPDEDEFSKIKKMLLELYSLLKENIKKKSIFIEDNQDSEESDEKSSKILSIIDLINSISIYVNFLLETKNINKEESYYEEENEEKPLYKQYEELLIKAEDDIRRHIKVEQQLKIKIEDLEFELDDYRTGKIKKKVKNLICINEQGNYSSYNFQKHKSHFKDYENYNSNNNKGINIEKPILVNSNNNYIITKLKKENENLRIKLSKLENETNNISNNDKYRQIENKIIKQKLVDGIRITKNIINNKNYISKNNYYSFANNTFSNNFYNIKESKFKINNNNSTIDDIKINLKNFNKMILSHNTNSTNSFVINPKKTNKSRLIKSLSILTTDSNNKNVNKQKKIIYNKNRLQLKKIQNKFSDKSNCIEIKIKDNNINFNAQNQNRKNNKKIYTFKNNDTKDIFAKKMKLEKKRSSKLNLNMTNNNLYHTDRKKSNINNKFDANSNIESDNKERYTLNIPNYEFNLTWSKFPLKNINHSSQVTKGKFSANNQTNTIQNIIRNTTNINNNVNNNINKKLLIEFRMKNKYSENNNLNKIHNKIKKDITPQKIKINRRKTLNNIKANNSSMKNISNYINYTKPKMKDEFYMNMKNNINDEIVTYENNNIVMMKTQNNFYPEKGDIYVRKKRSPAFGLDFKGNKKL